MISKTRLLAGLLGGVFILMTAGLINPVFAEPVDSFRCELAFFGRDGSPPFGVKKLLQVKRLAEPSEFQGFTKSTGVVELSSEKSGGAGYHDRIRVRLSYTHYTSVDFDPEGNGLSRFARCIEIDAEIDGAISHFDCKQAGSNPFDPNDSEWVNAGVHDRVAHFPIAQWQMDIPLPEGTVHYACTRL